MATLNLDNVDDVPEETQILNELIRTYRRIQTSGEAFLDLWERLSNCLRVHKDRLQLEEWIQSVVDDKAICTGLFETAKQLQEKHALKFESKTIRYIRRIIKSWAPFPQLCNSFGIRALDSERFVKTLARVAEAINMNEAERKLDDIRRDRLRQEAEHGVVEASRSRFMPIDATKLLLTIHPKVGALVKPMTLSVNPRKRKHDKNPNDENVSSPSVSRRSITAPPRSPSPKAQNRRKTRSRSVNTPEISSKINFLGRCVKLRALADIPSPIPYHSNAANHQEQRHTKENSIAEPPSPEIGRGHYTPQLLADISTFNVFAVSQIPTPSSSSFSEAGSVLNDLGDNDFYGGASSGSESETEPHEKENDYELPLLEYDEANISQSIEKGFEIEDLSTRQPTEVEEADGSEQKEVILMEKLKTDNEVVAYNPVNVNCGTSLGSMTGQGVHTSPEPIVQESHSSKMPLITTQNYGLALDCLKPGCRLNDSIVLVAIQHFVQDEFAVIDPLAFQTFNDKPTLDKPRLGGTARYWLIPMHHVAQEHWTLIFIDRFVGEIQHFDSMPELGCREQVQVTMEEQFQVRRYSASGRQWRYILDSSTPHQESNFDCGIHTVVNAIFLMAGLSFPQRIDCSDWRIIISQSLGSSVDVSNLAYPKALPTTELGAWVTSSKTILNTLFKQHFTFTQVIELFHESSQTTEEHLRKHNTSPPKAVDLIESHVDQDLLQDVLWHSHHRFKSQESRYRASTVLNILAAHKCRIADGIGWVRRELELARNEMDELIRIRAEVLSCLD